VLVTAVTLDIGHRIWWPHKPAADASLRDAGRELEPVGA
jgi:hypothetical protein